ncbi:MAG: slipin family protein [Planctomycetes bacterium]|nr:slipin family protein [Planctomycetota bacterium]
MIWKRIKIRTFEVGLVFREGEFQGLLSAGRHGFFDPWNHVRVEVVSQREPWLVHEKLDLIIKSGALHDRAVVLDLADHERALVWIDNRFSHILPAGQYVYWTGQRTVRTEIVDARQVRFTHAAFNVIIRSALAQQTLEVYSVPRDRVGVLFIDGQFVEVLNPGDYAFWCGGPDARVVEVDLRESMVDISGQEIITADKVTLRVNAVVTYRIVDARRVLNQTDDVRQALYRETQLVLRGVIGARELDQLLAEKDAVASEIAESVKRRADELGLAVASVGIRDVILPGEMKELLNKVTEARKAAEANLISRREETAAMRSQANTARLLAENPTLMRLRELEVLEKIAATAKLNVFVGEKGLTDQVRHLISSS